MRAAALLLVLAAALLLPEGAAVAQGGGRTGAINAHLVILNPPLATVGTKPLQFGFVVPGTPKTVLPRDAAAGQLRVSGIRNKRWLIVSLSLPPALTRAGGATLPLDFDGDYAGLCEAAAGGVCDEDSFVDWNPVVEPSYTDTPSNIRKRGKSGRQTYALDHMIIYIGGRALPSAGQLAGTYTGTITVTLTTN